MPLSWLKAVTTFCAVTLELKLPVSTTNTIKRIYRNLTAIVSTETINKLAIALEVSTIELMEDIPNTEEGDPR